MEQMINDLIGSLKGVMDESINDGGQIASSAIAMAVERSHDLRMNPLITVIMLKYLAEINVKLLFEQSVKDMKFIPREMHEKQLRNLERLIKGICEGRTKQVTIG